MLRKIRVEANERTPAGIFLPPRSQSVELQVPEQLIQTIIWRGNISFKKTTGFEKKIPQKLEFRTEILFLITQFIQYNQENPKANSSYMMIVEREGLNPLVFEASRSNGNLVYLTKYENMTETTVVRLRREGRVYSNLISQ